MQKARLRICISARVEISSANPIFCWLFFDYDIPKQEISILPLKLNARIVALYFHDAFKNRLFFYSNKDMSNYSWRRGSPNKKIHNGGKSQLNSNCDRDEVASFVSKILPMSHEAFFSF